MKIVIDSAIPYINGVFEPYAEVKYIAGSEIKTQHIKDADALVVRTRTRCNASLLAGSKIRHIASATIGYDHIDLQYCKSHNIGVSTAAGCNARGVLQWFAAAIKYLNKNEGWQPHERTIGIVGVGNVGSLIAEYCKDWGFRTLLCDPPRAEREGSAEFISLEQMLPECDIITIHTPLDESTKHMINDQTIAQLPPHSTIMNSARGEVIDTAAMRDVTSQKLIFDVWENEPNIDKTLLQRAALATPHIAGYSLQGKANATAMAVAAVAHSLALPITNWHPDVERSAAKKISWENMLESISEHFAIEELSDDLKANYSHFESMRNEYNYRKEYF